MRARRSADGPGRFVLAFALALLACVGQRGPRDTPEAEAGPAGGAQPEGAALCRADEECVLRAGQVQAVDRIPYLVAGCRADGPKSCLALAEAELFRAPELRQHLNWAAERGCELGAWNACSIAGASYRYASGGTKDLGRAYGYFEIACAHEGRLGCASVAEFLLGGIHVKRDPARAMKLFAKECDETSHALACRMYASGLLAGTGVPDPEDEPAVCPRQSPKSDR